MDKLARRTAAASLVLIASALSACGGQAATRSQATKVGVDEKNFQIDLPTTLHPGRTTFVINGVGPSMHEFNVARTDLDPKDLPLADDGTVDDQNPHDNFVHVAEAEGIDIGTRKTLSVDLSPGTYVVYCNMDGHYQSGMATRVTVSA